MGVSTYNQPDNTSQTGTAYKEAIDGATAVHHRMAGPFACHEQATPDMTVAVDAGAITQAEAVPTEVAAQNTATLTAPSTNPRSDIVYVDRVTGTVGVATGTEAASPTDPAIPAGKIAVARVSLTVAMAEITDADLDDLRAPSLDPALTADSTDTLTGKSIDNADNTLTFSASQAFEGAFLLEGVLTASQITADQDDYAPDDGNSPATGLSNKSVLRLSSDATRTITGLAGGSDGRLLVVHNVGSNDIVLSDENASSTAANRFALTADLTLDPDAVAVLQYDNTSSRWRAVSGGAGTTVDVQLFTASGTWTKPGSGDIALIECWGGGGGGGYGNTPDGGGGGGGGYARIALPLSMLGSSETVTIGAGGAAGASSGNAGSVGGTTSFGSVLNAYGGGGGAGGSASQGHGGGGGGSLGAGATAITTAPGIGGDPGGGATDGAVAASGQGGGAGGDSVNGANDAGAAFWGGGGGGGSVSTGAGNGGAGGDSVMGGGGGGGSTSTGAVGSGGTSAGGGAGGDGGDSSGTNAQAGTQPAGGGGGCNASNPSPGAGAAGQVRVTVW